MTLSEKITMLRKQNGWSQEDLAEKLNISRQAVSKWESDASIPDLDKIIKMSEIFEVSTDYLLKDGAALPADTAPSDSSEYEAGTASSDTAAKETVRRVSSEDANTYLELVQKHAGKFALAIFLLVCSPICMIIMSGLADSGDFGITENMAGGFGCSVLLLIVAFAVVLLILNGMSLSSYDYLEKDAILLEYGVSGAVEEKQKSFDPVYHKCIAAGVSFFILGVVPLLLSAALTANELIYIYCTGVLLFFVACGVALCTWSGMIHASYAKLLQTEDYSPENKLLNKRTSFFPGIYWCTATAIYLGISFYTRRWESTWIVWPVAGVLYAALHNLIKALVSFRK